MHKKNENSYAIELLNDPYYNKFGSEFFMEVKNEET